MFSLFQTLLYKCCKCWSSVQHVWDKEQATFRVTEITFFLILLGQQLILTISTCSKALITAPTWLPNYIFAVTSSWKWPIVVNRSLLSVWDPISPVFPIFGVCVTFQPTYFLFCSVTFTFWTFSSLVSANCTPLKPLDLQCLVTFWLQETLESTQFYLRDLFTVCMNQVVWNISSALWGTSRIYFRSDSLFALYSPSRPNYRTLQ